MYSELDEPLLSQPRRALPSGLGGRAALGRSSSLNRAARGAKVKAVAPRAKFGRFSQFRLRSKVKLRVDIGELALWWALAWRSAAREVAELVPWIITLVVVGDLGTRPQAAMAVAENWGYFFMDVSWEASSSTQAVLVSQAHGALNVTAMRGWLILSTVGFGVVTVIVSLVFFLTPQVLGGIGFNMDLVQLAGVYARWSVPALWLNMFNITASVQLAAAQMPNLPMAIAVASCCVNIALTYILVLGRGVPGWGGDGLRGAALAWVAGSALASFAYIFALRWMFREGRETAFHGEGEGGGMHHVPLMQPEGEVADGESSSSEEEEDDAEVAGLVTDPANVGWRRSLHYLASRRRWRAYFRQFLPSLLSCMLNGWQYQVISFIAAKLGEEEIDAHNCALALFEISHALAVGMADSAAVRVGYHLGRGDAAAAKKAAIAAGAGAAAVGLGMASAGILLRRYMGRIFSSDPKVVSIIESLANPFWLAFMCLCVGTVLLQVLAGQGRVRIQSAVYLVSGYLVAVPYAFVSYYAYGAGLGGLWAGLLCGNVVLLLLSILLVARSDWAGLAAFACAQQDAAEAAAVPPEEPTPDEGGVGGKRETRAEGLLRELEAESEPAELAARVGRLAAGGGGAAALAAAPAEAAAAPPPRAPQRPSAPPLPPDAEPLPVSRAAPHY